MRFLPVLLALLAMPAAAQETRRHPPAVLLPGIGATDPRQPVPLDQMPWRALGRVQTELGGRCTGALIGPRQVLTAAHCLVATRARQYLQPASVHFLLGYDRGTRVAQGRAIAFRLPREYRPGQGPAGADWAVITLDRAIGTPDRILPLLRDPPLPRSPVMLGGYQQDRPERLYADMGCRLLGVQSHADAMHTLVHDCAGTRGSSGAPLLARTPDGNWAIIGVQSAMAAEIALGHAALAGVVKLE